MTKEQNYNEIVKLGIRAARCENLLVVPLALLYDAMRERKELVPLEKLPRDQKLKYWEQARKEYPEPDKFRRVLFCQATYLKELLT